MKSRLLAIAFGIIVASSAIAEPAKQLTLHQAIAKVERETHGKVLSAEIKHHGRHVIYRIKVLTPKGEVQVIEVPADGARKQRPT